MYYTKTFSSCFLFFYIFLKKFILWQSVKKKDLMSKYLLKAYSRAANFLTILTWIFVHFSKNRLINTPTLKYYCIYTHPNYYIQIQDIKTKCLQFSMISLIHTPHGLQGIPLYVPTTVQGLLDFKQMKAK
ncbi:hypothetical protein KIL84_010181 [Mauremys mutica]|uniref:Uncharacterized protein n=1 Tax=Mauremys mutica TaxID=74926 RepID=A0A9D4AZK0_9SAUR|nr:hypothetical protein KIL84_010181 [Mauremys mutica]